METLTLPSALWTLYHFQFWEIPQSPKKVCFWQKLVDVRCLSDVKCMVYPENIQDTSSPHRQGLVSNYFFVLLQKNSEVKLFEETCIYCLLFSRTFGKQAFYLPHRLDFSRHIWEDFWESFDFFMVIVFFFWAPLSFHMILLCM